MKRILSSITLFGAPPGGHMKPAWLGLLFTTLLTGCDESPKDIDFLSNLTSDYDVVAVLHMNPEDEVPYLRIHSAGQGNGNSALVNGDTLLEWGAGRPDVWWEESLNLVFGEEVDYSFAVDGHTHSGTIRVPDSLQLAWPPVFDTSQDFVFTWSSSSPVDRYIIHYAFNNIGRTISDYEYHQLDGSESQYRIPAHFFQGIAPSGIEYFEASIMPLNFNTEGNNFLIFVTNRQVYETD